MEAAEPAEAVALARPLPAALVRDPAALVAAPISDPAADRADEYTEAASPVRPDVAELSTDAALERRVCRAVSVPTSEEASERRDERSCAEAVVVVAARAASMYVKRMFFVDFVCLDGWDPVGMNVIESFLSFYPSFLLEYNTWTVPWEWLNERK